MSSRREVSSADREVRAAGGVVWRPGAQGGCDVLIVHRPRYEDWSLPKGKRELGETDEACALREVEEEAGLMCVLGDELPEVRYVDADGRPKRVRYWAMRVRSGGFVQNEEVDEVAWMSLPAAAQRLTYDGDRQVLEAFREQVAKG